MDQRSYEMAVNAYQMGDWSRCVATLSAARVPGEAAGAADHLRGNALMNMGLYSDAAKAYGEALADPSYGKTGALSCNCGRALLAAGDINGAVAALSRATQDPNYSTPYKAYIALGNAYSALGNSRDAGIAFRNAAIDESNPDPSAALLSLGKCFLDLGRPVDAVEAYRTALDFAGPAENQNAIWASLGVAYVAANRMSEASDAFGHATSDGSYQLTSEEQSASLAAQNAMASLNIGPSETDQLLADAGYGGGYDPLDPTGASGVIMPSPEDTGFFSVNESDLVAQDKQHRRGGKPKHRVLKFFLVVVILAVAAAGVLYWQGYGFPTQESVVTNLFASTNENIDSYLARSLSSEAKGQIIAALPEKANLSFGEIKRSMGTSTVRVVATLPEGGSQTYDVGLVRDGISWKVTSVDMVFDSVTGSARTTGNTQSSSTNPQDTGSTASSTDTSASGDAVDVAPGETTQDPGAPTQTPASTETTDTSTEMPAA